jgi:hypothetical protein
MTDGLAALQLSMFDAPAAAATQAAPIAAPDFTVMIKRTRSGQDILVCSADPAPQSVIDRAGRDGLALFTFREIDAMRQCDQDLARKIIAAKLTFHGCSVTSIMQDSGGEP